MKTARQIQSTAEQFWEDAAFASEAALLSRIHIIQSKIYVLCQNRDVDGVEQWLAVYRYAESRCRKEPLAAIYEHGIRLITLTIDSTYSSDVLHAFDERRARP
jgi:hypothetical protein